nr:MAG TPA: Protein of unknown function (DUF2746) [Siphoviridae sp. ctcOR4]
MTATEEVINTHTTNLRDEYAPTGTTLYSANWVFLDSIHLSGTDMEWR